MVRKSLILLVVIVMTAVMLTVSASAVSYTPYDGNISTSYITIFRDIVSNIGFNDDYVFFRSGQYEYKMAVGDLTYENGTFSGTGLLVYTIDTDTGSSYSSSYHYSWTTEDFTLTPGTALIYSNLGQYPTLIERGDNYEFAQVLLLLVVLCVLLLRSIFNFCLRNRC